LFLNTLAELFAGSEDLFRGLAVHARWDWSRRFPLIRISFGGGVVQSRGELDRRILALLRDNAERLGIHCRDPDDPAGCFSDLIARAHAAHGERVVVLVDEYDKPILDNLTGPGVAREIRDGLRNLYSVIKDTDAHIRFAFLTGASKFSKVSLFSGLNNLNDITVDAAYSALCGYTEADLEQVFAPELDGLDRDLIRSWYNGYNWTGEAVYNPFDVLLLFDKRQFRPWWFETATPTFLVDLLLERQVFVPDLGQMIASDTLLSTFDVDHIATEALLFQAGYLTIHRVRQLGALIEYRLRWPNLEVQAALTGALLDQDRASDSHRAGAGQPPLRAAAGQRLRRPPGLFPGAVRRHSDGLAPQQPHCELRGLLRQCLLCRLRVPGHGPDAGGVQQRRTARHGIALQRPSVPVRIQGGGAGTRWWRAGADQGTGLCRALPGRRPADPPGRRRIQPRAAGVGGIRRRESVGSTATQQAFADLIKTPVAML
jgi:hypothetical protein